LRVASLQAAQHVQACDAGAADTARPAAPWMTAPMLQQHHCGPRTEAEMIAVMRSLRTM
jgi:hypothetical protein